MVVIERKAGVERQIQKPICTYPQCNCPFDMAADNACLRNRPQPERGRKPCPE